MGALGALAVLGVATNVSQMNHHRIGLLPSACLLAYLPIALLAGCTSSSQPTSFSTVTTVLHAATPHVDTAWVGAIRTDAQSIEALLGRAAAAADAADESALQSVCTEGLGSLPGWRESAADIPVPAVHDPYVSALDDFQSSFTDCLDANYSTAATYMRQGSAEIGSTTDAIVAYTATLGG